MKRTISFLLAAFMCHVVMAQVDYYDITTHENVNVNKNVNVSGYVHQSQTVTTIDYGAMALANAERERNRLEAQKYADEQSRLRALEIAANPLKAYDYGQPISNSYKRNKDTRDFLDVIGFKKASQWWVLPSAFFYFVSFNTIQNISEDGITTYIDLGFPSYIRNEHVEGANQFVEDFNKGVEIGSFDVSENGDTLKYISHTKQMATVWGYEGRRNTLYWEDGGQIGITDNYFVRTYGPGNGIINFCKVRYYGDKSEVSWEQLEGRRYYLKKLVDRVIATARLTDYEIVKEK